MDTEGTIRDNLQIGMEVEINPQDDKTRKIVVRGHIQEFLSRASHHPYGILVKLSNGNVGRVKKILSESSDNNTLTSTKYEGQATYTHQAIQALISNGENHHIEFKSSVLWSQNLNAKEIGGSDSFDLKEYGTETSKIVIAKALAGLLNSDGGHLFIGIKEIKSNESNELIGIESEFKKLIDPCTDGYRRMIIDKIIKPYFPSSIFNHFNDYLKIDFHEILGKTICSIRVIKSDKKVFLKIKRRDLFFIRVDATTRQIFGEEIVDYCYKRFG